MLHSHDSFCLEIAHDMCSPRGRRLNAARLTWRMGLPVTVLIVLGDARVRQLVQDDLQDRCEVIAASDPGHARELLSRGGVDIVIAGVGATSDDADNLQVLCDCLRASDVPLAFVAGAPPASGSVSSCDDAPSLRAYAERRPERHRRSVVRHAEGHGARRARGVG